MPPVSPTARLSRLSRHLVTAPVASAEAAEIEDVAAVRKVMDSYTTAVWVGDANLARSLYHESAAFNGSFGTHTMLLTPQSNFKDLEKQASNRETLKEKGVPQNFREVLSVNVYGSIATAVVQEAIAKNTVTDCYHLIKLDGHWKIISQLFIGSKKLAALDDIAAVRDIMRRYTEGTWTADEAMLRGIFHEKAIMNGFVGKHAMLGSPQPFFDDMAKLAAAGTSFRDKGLAYSSEVTEVRVYGQTATALVREEGYAGSLGFADAFHLVKVEGRWWIVSKLFMGWKRS